MKPVGGEPGASMTGTETDSWIVRKDGEKRYVHASYSPLEEEGRAIIILNDIKERKLAEDRLKKLYENETSLRRGLQNEISKRVQLTHALVHELKTPLTPIVTVAKYW